MAKLIVPGFNLEGMRKQYAELAAKIEAGGRVLLVKHADAIVRQAKVRAKEDTGELKRSVQQHGVKKSAKNDRIYIAVTLGYPVDDGQPYNVGRLQEFGSVRNEAVPMLIPAARIERRKFRTAMRQLVKKCAKEVTD